EASVDERLRRAHNCRSPTLYIRRERRPATIVTYPDNPTSARGFGAPQQRVKRKVKVRAAGPQRVARQKWVAPGLKKRTLCRSEVGSLMVVTSSTADGAMGRSGGPPHFDPF